MERVDTDHEVHDSVIEWEMLSIGYTQLGSSTQPFASHCDHRR